MASNLTIPLYSRKELISNLPEVGDTLLRVANGIDEKVLKLYKLYMEILEDEQELLTDIKESWTDKEISDHLTSQFVKLNDQNSNLIVEMENF